MNAANELHLAFVKYPCIGAITSGTRRSTSSGRRSMHSSIEARPRAALIIVVWPRFRLVNPRRPERSLCRSRIRLVFFQVVGDADRPAMRPMPHDEQPECDDVSAPETTVSAPSPWLGGLSNRAVGLPTATPVTASARSAASGVVRISVFLRDFGADVLPDRFQYHVDGTFDSEPRSP